MRIPFAHRDCSPPLLRTVTDFTMSPLPHSPLHHPCPPKSLLLPESSARFCAQLTVGELERAAAAQSSASLPPCERDLGTGRSHPIQPANQIFPAGLLCFGFGWTDSRVDIGTAKRCFDNHPTQRFKSHPTHPLIALEQESPYI